MANSNFLTFTSKRVPSTKGKKNLKGSVYIPPLEKAAAEDWLDKSIKQLISSPPPSPKTFQFDQEYMNTLDSILASPIGRGDVTVDSNAAKFAVNPVTKSVTYVISRTGTYKKVDPFEVFCHYVALAYSESRFNTGATSRSSSARGQLQLLKGTYKLALGRGERVLSRLPQWVSLSIASLFRNDPSKSWSTFDHNNPAKDATQYLAILGQLYMLIDRVDQQWMFTNGSWIAREPNDVTRSFLAGYGNMLRNEATGRQALITCYHIIGIGAFGSKRGTFTIPYKGRINEDCTTFNVLLGHRRLYDIILGRAEQSFSTSQINARPMGDVAIPTELASGGDAIAINAYIAKKLKLTMPVMAMGNAFVTSRYGPRKLPGKKRRQHEGIDIRARTPIPVFAVDSGLITYARHCCGYGLNIVLRCDDGSGFRYAHLSKVFVKPGLPVVKGQMLGLTGATGTDDPHLHFEYFPNATLSVNPNEEADPLTDPKRRWKFAANSVNV